MNEGGVGELTAAEIARVSGLAYRHIRENWRDFP